MTVLKEPIVVRPTSQHRHSSNTMAGSLPKSRPHSQSMSATGLHPGHRVTRRKSMSNNIAGNNLAAMAAAAKGISGAPLVDNSPPSSSSYNPSRRLSKPASQFRGPGLSMTPSAHMASSVPSNASGFRGDGAPAAVAKTEVVADGPSLVSMAEHEKSNKARIRRASEGSGLSAANKTDAKRTSGSELRCEKCGKGYKHSSCLTKHLWEHTPEWQYTSKLLISKHQQVQLLEAASVLVAMNAEAGDSDSSSPSPPPSGSDLRDELSSTDTTPPPQIDDHAVGSFPRSHYPSRSSKRYSGNSSAYSQSYQSTVFSDNGYTGHGHYRQWSNVSDRPTTSGTSIAGSYQDENDQADLAAAVGLLSCSYGTPKSGNSGLPHDVPPVPPLPAKFMEFNTNIQLSGSTTVTAQQSSLRGGDHRYHPHESKDVDMDDESEDDFRRGNSQSRGRVDEDDDAFFGRMEE